MRLSVVVIVVLTVVSLVVLFIDNFTVNPVIFDYSFTKIIKENTAQPCATTNQSLDNLPPIANDHYIVEPEPDYTGIIFDNCELPRLNPWDPSISKFLKPETKQKPCTSNFTQMTKLENGRLTKNTNDTTCEYRCLYAVNDNELDYGAWSNIGEGVTPKCDIIETKCYKDDASKPNYEFLHAQIFRNDTKKTAKENNQMDVHVIIIDSVSHSSFVRTLPRTYHELMANYEAIPFSHLNKIAHNSRPNALAMFIGKSNRNIEKSPMSVGYKSDFNSDDACRKPLNDEQFVGTFFNSKGYKTMMIDDWALGPFNWPNCNGFTRKATDHMMKPFQLRVDGSKYKNKKIAQNVYGGMCKESYQTLTEYLDGFINAYDDKPKFTITWNVDIAHNDNNQLYHADNYFYDFFRFREEKFKNSYIFIMADHGMRFGAIRNTDIGETEDNNPTLLMVLPEKLRKNSQLVGTVRQNSHQLISHYDLYATFVDIAQPKLNETSKLIMHGSSLLRPLPQPRSCDRLRVPFEFCTCVRTKTKLPDNSNPGPVAAAKMIEKMNNVIETEKDLKDLCSPLALKENSSVIVEQFQSEGTLHLYQVTFTIQPGDGRFWGYIGQENNATDIKILSARFPRLDSYDKTAFCAKKSSFTAYCYCKSLLKT